MATYTVTNLDDSGNGSLRDAIDQANANAGADTIKFNSSLAGGTIRLASTLTSTDELTINGDVNNNNTPGITITGDAAGDDTTLAGGLTDIFGTPTANLTDNVAIIYSTGTANLTFNGLILTGGVSGGSGGAINAAADLKLTNSIVSGNQSFANGGGILAIGTATLTNVGLSGNRSTDNSGGGIEATTVNLTDSIVIGNTAHVSGGGVSATTATLLRSSVTGNQADSDGGGLFVFGTADITDSTLAGNSSGSAGGGLLADNAVLKNVTVSGNSAVVGGGGVYTNLDATITNSTFTANDGGTGGGGIDVDTGTLINSIVMGNVGADEILALTAPFVLTGGNIVGTDVFSGNTVVGSTTSSDVFDTGVLANNGGPVQTIALKADVFNPALDASNADAPATDVTGNTRVDQPGAPNTNGSAADLGALELQAVLNGSPVIGNPDAVIAAAGTSAFNIGVAAPTDPENDALTITLTALPGYGTLEFFDGSSFVTASANMTLTGAELASLRYTPPASGEFGGEDLVYTVFDGTHTVTGTVEFSVEIDSAGPAKFLFTSYDGSGKPLPDLYSVDANGTLSTPLIDNPNGDDAGIDGGFFQYAGKLYFNAFEAGGEFLFAMDSAGVVTKIANTSDPGAFFPGLVGVPANFIEFAGRLYFATDQVGEIKADGTSQLIDINGGNLAFTSNQYGGFVEFDHSLYFSAFTDVFGGNSNGPDLIRIDADDTVTQISTRAPANAAFGSFAGEDGGFAVFNNALYFNALSDTLGDTLFRLDAGSTTPVPVDPTGTVLDHTFGTVQNSAFHIFNDSLYFTEFSPGLGTSTLFQLDACGCLNEITFLGEALQGAGQFGGLVDFAGSMFFFAETASDGPALFQLDACGCLDIVPGTSGTDFNHVSGFAQFNGSLYFDAFDSSGHETLFKLDADGFLSDVEIGGSGILNAGVEGGFKVLGDSLYFSGYGPNGYEWFKLDADGTINQYDINPGAGGNGIVPGQMGGLGLFPFTVLHGTGGADVIKGGVQNEVIDAGGAKDVIYSSGGNDIITGGGGADTFKFDDSGPATVDRIMDYSVAGGDVIDLSALLDAHFTPTSNVMDFVRLVPVGQNLIVQVDVDGAANGQNWSDVAILDGSNLNSFFGVVPDEATAFFGGAKHTLVEIDSFNIQTTALTGGGWAVTWNQTGDDDGIPDINVYARVFNSAGQQIGGTFEVSAPNDMDDQYSVVTPLSNGGFAVTWESCDDEVLTRVYDANGVDVSSGVQDAITGAFFPQLTQSIALANGGYAVLWGQSDLGDDNVYVNTFDAHGVSLSAGPALVNDAASPFDQIGIDNGSFDPVGFANHSSIVALQHGFAVTWEANPTDDGAGNLHQNLFVRVFDFDGTPVTGAIQVNGPDGADQDGYEDIVALGGDNFAIQWESDYSTGVEQTYSRLFTTTDFINYTSPGPVRDDNNGDANIGAQSWHVAALKNGGYVSLWGQHDLTNSAISDVFVQVYDANGAIAAGSQSGGIKVDATTGVYNVPDQVVSLAGGGFVVMYDTERDDGIGAGADQDVMIRVFAADGTATSGEVRVNAANDLFDAAVETIAFADGSFGVVWAQDAVDGSHQDLLLQRLDATGVLLGSQLLIGSTPFDASNPDENSHILELRDALSANGTLLVAAIDSVTLDFGTIIPGTGFNYFNPLDLHFINPPVNVAPVAVADSATVNEDSGANAIDVLANDTDIDGGPKSVAAVTQGSHGAVVVTGGGTGLTYQPNAGYVGSDSFTYTLNGGSSATVSVTVDNVDDPPVAVADSATVNEDSGANAIDVLANDTDIDGGPKSVAAVTQGSHGAVVVTGGGTGLTYQPSAGYFGPDSFTYTLNGGSLATVSVQVNEIVNTPPVDIAPVNTLPATLDIDANTGTAIGGLSIADPDAGSGSLTTTLSVAHGTLTVASAGGAAVSGSGTGTVTLNGTLAQINATLGAASNVVYRGAHDDFGTDTFTMVTNDNGNTGSGGPLADTDQVTIHLNTHLIGTPGPDSFTALPGNERIDALTGVDTITFGFKLVDATVTYVGNEVIIDGPSSHTVLTGFEVFNFADGTVNNNDGDALVDDLFYYSRYHDVWNAHVDADAHYHTFGWHEGRDPDAFFSTVVYLSANPDVKASGADPLIQFDQTGWKAGHNPLTFDINAYLAANPDVKAAQVDPLEHFLANGAQEGRQPIAPTELLSANGFDYVYYLQHNPDVAAAHVDPLLHFETVGWKEGRNPNALFDTNGYLATYADVKAAGINPLDHYNQFGWHEGRDPSVAFDTTDYLSHYPDVANAHINPLNHFLANGIHEGRSAFADGMWG